jgi:hypothetical protein
MRSIGYALTLSMCLNATAQMIRNDAIGNDPALEKLCIERAIAKRGTGIDGPLRFVPFEIDSKTVSNSRRWAPETTWIALQNDLFGLLVSCANTDASGRFEPTFETRMEWAYHTLSPPPHEVKKFQPGTDTREGIKIAVNRCFDAAVAKINRPNLDHTSSDQIVTEGPRPGRVSIGGVKTERFDVMTTGTAYYRTGAPDMYAVDFSCLFSPMLEIKAIELKPLSH